MQVPLAKWRDRNSTHVKKVIINNVHMSICKYQCFSSDTLIENFSANNSFSALNEEKFQFDAFKIIIYIIFKTEEIIYFT